MDVHPHPLSDLTEAELADAIAYSNHFRRMATGYPRAVTEAYNRDFARAMADSAEQVAANVAAWEVANGIPVRDWPAIGRAERDG